MKAVPEPILPVVNGGYLCVVESVMSSDPHDFPYEASTMAMNGPIALHIAKTRGWR